KLCAVFLILSLIASCLLLRAADFPGWRTNFAERAFLLSLVAAIGFTVVSGKRLNIPWRSRASWIALGLFVCCMHPNPILYLLAECSWFLGFMLPETESLNLTLEDLKLAAEIAEDLPPKIVPKSERARKGQVA